MIGRREFITLLGGAAAWPLVAHAQQPAIPVIGYLSAGSPPGSVAAFHKGLNETGYIEGRNVAIEYRYAQNQLDRLPDLAADLVRRRVAVISVVAGGTAARAAKAATTTIPIVFGTAGDPVQEGLVASLNRPGGNATGFSNLALELTAKRLGILHELLPSTTRFAVLFDPGVPNAEFLVSEARSAALTIGKQVLLSASTAGDIDVAFASLVQKRTDALAVNASNLFGTRRTQIVTLAAHHRVPTIYFARPYTEAGGLMSYGANIADQARQVGVYTGRILKGEKPADLPVMQAARFEFVINLQTAKTLGLTVSPALLATADEVIE
jgi:putative ABC transport system substrate-binding protein